MLNERRRRRKPGRGLCCIWCDRIWAACGFRSLVTFLRSERVLLPWIDWLCAGCVAVNARGNRAWIYDNFIINSWPMLESTCLICRLIMNIYDGQDLCSLGIVVVQLQGPAVWLDENEAEPFWSRIPERNGQRLMEWYRLTSCANGVFFGCKITHTINY